MLRAYKLTNIFRLHLHTGIIFMNFRYQEDHFCVYFL